MSESLTPSEWATIEAALLCFGAECGKDAPNDVNRLADGWQCVDLLRKINPEAADVLAAKLAPRIDTRYDGVRP